MTDPWEAPAQELIKRLAANLHDKVKPPAWANFVRTGGHTERAPASPDWWFIRSASVMRKLYGMGPIGVSRMAAEYGGKKDRGAAPYKAVKGSRSIISEIFHDLEKAGLVLNRASKGRVLSPEGLKLLTKAARDVMEELAAKQPSLKKYL